MNDQIPPEAVIAKLSGLVGALVSLKFINGKNVYDKSVMVGCGWATSYFVAPLIATKYNAPEGSVGFLLGLAAVGLCGLFFRFIEAAPIDEFWKKILKKIGK
jgi:hypothetical protein